MGFYGNIADSSHVHFQFDKIFSSRTEMDRACLSGIDGIYAGRFVLVKYDTESRIFQGDILYGYYGVGQNSNVLYRDTACTQPYIFTTFTEVPEEEIDAENWASYYGKIQQGNFYFKLTNENEFVEGQQYYIADAADGTNDSTLVSINTIVRLRDSAQAGALTSQFLQCTGTTSGQPATWTRITNSEHYQNYFDNFELDQRTYGDDFSHRGYDATVWQKVYGEGSGRFILIASLNTVSPSFEFISDPPSTGPLTAWIDPTSSEDIYKIHVPTHWGFQIKRADSVTDSETGLITYPMSDQIDENNNHLEIYMNLGNNDSMYHIRESNIDNQHNDEILLTPTGKSGTLYNGEEKEDLLELSIHLPSVGNMIDKGYDLIYGKKEIVDEETNQITSYLRQRDVAWYPATSTDAEKQYGDITLGGKTYDLTTLAGVINTSHNIIGQIVYDLPSWPTTDEEKRDLSDKYLYRYNDKYYRRGISTTPVDTIDSDFVYDPVTIPAYEQGANFPGNKYYTDSGNEKVEATSWATGNSYYLKNIRENLYSPITLEHFIRGQYYLKDGDNYICDHASEYPSYPERKYYLLPENTPEHEYIRTYYTRQSAPSADSYILKAQYENDGSFYIYSDNKLIPSYSDSPSLNLTYYTISGYVALNQGELIYYYYPGIYYYSVDTVENGQTVHHFYLINDSIEEFNGKDQNNNPYPNYYRLQFSTTPAYGLDQQGNIIQYYTVVDYERLNTIYSFPDYYKQTEENPLTGMEEPRYQHLYILNEETGEYLPFSHLNDLGIINGRSPYSYPYVLYELTIQEYDPNELFLPGAYYYQQIDIDTNNNEYISYLKDKTKRLESETRWYLILDDVEINPSVTPFYLPDKYWYNPTDNQNEFSISSSFLANKQYYTKKVLYVQEDQLGQCPPGFKWNDYALYIPPSITLCTYEEKVDLIEISELGRDSNSLYGLLIALHKLYSADDDRTRTIDTVRGAYNTLLDMLYQIKRLKPERMLYVNNFGQIDSLDAGPNKLFITDDSGYIQTITLSELKTRLQNI